MTNPHHRATFLQQSDPDLARWNGEMTEIEYARKLDEVDRLLNDPDVPMEPGRVWSLLAEISHLESAPLSKLA